MLPPLPKAPPPLPPLPAARVPIPRNDGVSISQVGNMVRLDLFGEVFASGYNLSNGAGRVSAMITVDEALGLSRQLAALALRLQGA